MLTERSRILTGIEAFIIGFFFFKLAYIPFEFAFNAQLVDVASSGASLEEIHGLEFYGRAISSLALALAYMRLRIRRLKFSVRLVVTATALFLVSFFLQKALILWVVKQSSGDERHIALLLNFLPAAVRHTHVEGFDFESYDTPEAKTFLAEAGAMLFFSKSAHKSIDQQLDNLILGDLIEKTVADEDRNLWQNYRKLSTDLVSFYAKYADFRKLAREQRISPDGAEAQLDELIASAKQAWQSANDRLNALIKPAALEKMIYSIEYYFYHRTQPKAQEAYRQQMLELFGTAVEDTYWCSNLQCPVDKSFMPDRIRKLLLKKTSNDTGIDPLLPFDANSSAVASFIRKTGANNGIHLPDSWTPLDRATFATAVMNASKKKLNTQIDGELSKTLGASLWNDLTFEDFENLPSMQEKIRTTIEKEVSIANIKGPISVKWDRATFERRIVMPSLDEEVRKIKAEKLGSLESYEDTGSLEQIGRDAVKRIIIPPISLSLSSFFALFNVVSLLTLALGFVSTRIERKSFLILTLASLLIFVLPFIGSVGLAKYDGYKYVTETSSEYTPISTKIMSWNVRLQPVIYPFAAWTREHTLGNDFFVISDSAYKRLDDLDRAVLDSILSIF